MNKLTKATFIILTAGSLCLGKAAAELQPDYQKGQDQLGKSMLIDLAVKGGGDSLTEGYVWWAAEMNNLWNPGERVTLTGIALPIRGDTAAPNVLTFTFYDLGNDNAYDSKDVVVGEVEESYPGGDSGVWFAKFEQPVTFTAKGSGIAVAIGGRKGPMRLKVVNAGTAPGIIRKKRNDGEPVGTEFPNFAMSLAGTAEKGAK